MVVTEEIKNLRRLEAQRNELNAKGWYTFLSLFSKSLTCYMYSHASGHSKLLPNFAYVFLISVLHY